ncbi:OmpA family protein [Pseudomonas nitroreducens]|uniref:OmpA family protein n=1 Tax=Pseudomonas nitroreducens TaxID=46680 RepID=UPI0032214166
MPMQFKWTRALWLWAGVLGLVLTLAILPLSPLQRSLAASLVILSAALGWFFAGRLASRQRQTVVLAKDSVLPAAEFRQPVVVVCGDGLSALFGDAPASQLVVRVSEQGCYLRAAGQDRLPVVIDYLLANRPHWAGQISAFYVVNPAERLDKSLLAGSIQSFRHQVSRIRHAGVALPILLGSYLPAARSQSSWFSSESDHEGLAVLEGTRSASLDHWQQSAADTPSRALRMRLCVEAESLANWLASAVLPHLSSREIRAVACPPVACALALVPGASAAPSGNLWSTWLHERTSLDANSLADPGGNATLPFPDPFLASLPRHPGLAPRRRAMLWALWLFVLAGAVALCSSAWQNVLLLRQVSDDLRRYQAIPEPATPSQPEHGLREQAVAVLRKDAARLDRFYREGEPLSIGLGLYTAERIRPPLLAAIAAYRPPVAIVQPATKIPDPVRLDSLSLFTSGSAELKPGSTKVLVNALVGIKAQPGWLIVIAGHTDSTGDDARNLALSRNRAGAVRDWMQKMGDLPDSCFAVQGHGASQPIASNDTPAGRAANRRVDIRLVPETGACVVPAQAPEGQPQSPHYQATLSSQ